MHLFAFFRAAFFFLQSQLASPALPTQILVACPTAEGGSTPAGVRGRCRLVRLGGWGGCLGAEACLFVLSWVGAML